MPEPVRKEQLETLTASLSLIACPGADPDDVGCDVLVGVNLEVAYWRLRTTDSSQAMQL
jgi:hypothetical protein